MPIDDASDARLVVLYATDTMADWEYGHLVAGLGMTKGAHRLVVAGETTGIVRTAGGLALQPDAALEDLDVDRIAMLVLPGASTWASGHDEVLALATRLEAEGVAVAAICGGTLGLARTGMLDDRRHTSNAPEYPAFAAEYRGASRYEQAPTVVDRQVITASATAPLEFAKTVFEVLGSVRRPVLEAWYALYSTGDPKYYYALVELG
ncbi:DJ-1/PfpI family protein [Agromyces sp. CF514]|uniref:DJ-1/PfpI family protein n=1 Tax=Agromyces sp. CF514 TaxID=1881031 RepID=UPI0008E82569|nr:DJ-1/PfpI family protein [Agromyces sp. CF514]SFR67190.1 DJ-1/PfpI family protein [Agromyces sp. CF514]